MKRRGTNCATSGTYQYNIKENGFKLEMNSILTCAKFKIEKWIKIIPTGEVKNLN